MTFRQILKHNVVLIRLAYRIRRADVLLVSFPKSGRTWLRAMIGKVLCDRTGMPEAQMLRTYELTRMAGLPLAEVTHDGSAIEDGNSFSQLPTDKRRYASQRVVFLHRDVRDVVISSYFHATKRARVFHGTLSEFIRHERFRARKILDFERIWARNQHVPAGFLLVRYEEIHRQPAATLARVLEFMGVPASQDDIDRAVQFGAFGNMRRIEASGSVKQQIMRPGRDTDEESYKVRKGVVGGYRSYMSDDDVAYVEQLIEEIGQPFAADPAPAG